MKLPPFDPLCTDQESLEFLFGLVRLLKPTVLVEAGTYKGHGSIYLALACKLNKTGHVYTADPLSLANHSLSEAFSDAEVSPFITHCQTDYLTMLEEGTREGAQIDFAFLDASSQEEDGAKLRWAHFQATIPLLSPTGIICVHDTASFDWKDGEGGKSAERIRKECSLNFAKGAGLSVYQNSPKTFLS